MGRTRPAEQPPQEEEQSTTEEKVAALIAAILAGTIVVPNPLLAIAQALLALIPTGIPAALGARISADTARLVLTDQPSVTRGLTASSAASRDNLLYRARYGIAVVGRLVKKVRSVEDLPDALADERPNFEAHKAASQRRTAAALMVDAAIALHGTTLGWIHGHPKEPRPSHKAAHRRNFDARRIPASTGAYPGQLPNCTCTVSAPIPGARMLR